MGRLDEQPRSQVGEAEALRLGQALRAARKALGITVTAAAKAAQISRVTWHRLEKGERTVALGALVAAAQVLDMSVVLVPKGAAGKPAPSTGDDYLPLQILLADYPQLRQLAWQVGDDRHVLTPREALGLYERNWRHVQHAALDPRERALLDALRRVFGAEFLGV